MKNKELNSTPGFKFVKNDKVATMIGVWCFAFTSFACLMGIFPKNVETFSSEWFFQITLNILTPIVLVGLGLIFPKIARKTNK